MRRSPSSEISFPLKHFTRPEIAVTCVAEAGHDVAAVVEALIDSASEDRHIGVMGMECLHTGGRGEHADEAQARGPAGLELAGGLHRALAGGQHGIEQEHIGPAQGGGKFGIIGAGGRGFLIAGNADVRELRGGGERPHAIHHAQAGAQDGCQDEGPGERLTGGGCFQRRGDFHWHCLQLAGCFGKKKRGNFAEVAAEILGRSVAVPQAGQAGLQQGVGAKGERFHVVGGAGRGRGPCGCLGITRGQGPRCQSLAASMPAAALDRAQAALAAVAALI